MESELKAIVLGKESFKGFIETYFNAAENSYEFNFRNIETGEVLNLNVAKEFYEDYLNSGLALQEYIKKTSSAY